MSYFVIHKFLMSYFSFFIAHKQTFLPFLSIFILVFKNRDYMHQIVVLDAGEFDIPFFSGSAYAADEYRKHLQQLCKYELIIKSADSVREREEWFIEEQICRKICVIPPVSQSEASIL